MRSICVRPHVEARDKAHPLAAQLAAFKIAMPARTSSTGSAVSETRIVSPMPSDSSVPMPTAERMMPL